jgi:TPR repeat protein
MGASPDWSRLDLNALRKEASGGDPDAQWCLGRRLLARRTVEGDSEEGLHWLESSARADPARAWVLGGDHRDGRFGVPPSLEAARRWFRRAARGGEGRGALDLGLDAWLVRGDLRRARRWFRAALVLGDECAPMHLDWLDRKVDWHGRLRWARLPSLWERAEAGDARAAFLRGVARLDGFRVPRDRASGLAWIQAAADRGDRDAPLALGLAHRFGEGTPVDAAAAIAWLERAARAGDPVALYCAGHDWADHQVHADPGRAVRLFRRAASRSAFAAYELARHLEDGDGVRRDPSEADRLDLEAARGGDPRAQNRAGLIHRDGCEFADAHPRTAFGWFRRAAEQGEPNAQQDLGVLLHEGRGVRRDDRASVRWYRRAAARGNSGAMFNLFLCHRYGDGVTRNLRRGVAWLRRAAARGSSRAMARLGYEVFVGRGARRDPAAGVRWCLRALDALERRPTLADGAGRSDFTWAMDVAAHGYREGVGVARDLALAFAWWRRAARRGDSCAAFHLGVCYVEGTGVRRRRAEGIRWLQRAAAQGEARADARLVPLLGPRRPGARGRRAGSTGRPRAARI